MKVQGDRGLPVTVIIFNLKTSVYFNLVMIAYDCKLDMSTCMQGKQDIMIKLNNHTNEQIITSKYSKYFVDKLNGISRIHQKISVV